MQDANFFVVQIEALSDHLPQLARGALAPVDRLRKLKNSAPLIGNPRLLGARNEVREILGGHGTNGTAEAAILAVSRPTNRPRQLTSVNSRWSYVK